MPAATERIVKTPGTCGGRARIAGTRVRVLDIAAWHEQQGLTPQQIAAEYPTVSIEGAQAAIDYYHAHRAEIDAEAQHERELGEEFRRENPPLLPRKLAQLRSKIS